MILIWDATLSLNTKLIQDVTMPIRQFMRRMSLGIPVEEVDVTTLHSKQRRKFSHG